jgi:hypothetical protein
MGRPADGKSTEITPSIGRRPIFMARVLGFENAKAREAGNQEKGFEY